MTKILAFLCGGSLLVGTGCIAAPDDEAVATAEESVVVLNGMVLNGMVLNGMVLNGAPTGAMAAGALSPGALAALAPGALQDPSQTGDLTRQLVRYAVGCAFTPSQSFAVTWTDSAGVVHDDVYAGDLGLAPGWATGPLGSAGQQMVTACLAARVNRFGVSVQISLRSQRDPLEDETTAAELAAYPYVEGAFWGNLFASQPWVKACYVQANVDHSRAAQRTCAAGYVDPTTGAVLECGIIDILGPCSRACSSFSSADQAYSGCFDPVTGGRSQYVITSGLP
jgi:hypothetical protein